MFDFRLIPLDRITYASNNRAIWWVFIIKTNVIDQSAPLAMPLISAYINHLPYTQLHSSLIQRLSAHPNWEQYVYNVKKKTSNYSISLQTVSPEGSVGEWGQSTIYIYVNICRKVSCINNTSTVLEQLKQAFSTKGKFN